TDLRWPVALVLPALALAQLGLRAGHRGRSVTATDGGGTVERVPGLGPHAPVDADAGRGLQAAHGGPGGRAEGPVHREGGAALVELGLQGAHGLAAIA